MRIWISLIATVFITHAVGAIDGDHPKKWAIEGQFITKDQKTLQQVDDETQGSQQPTATVTANYSNEEGEIQNVEIASGRFDKGKILLEGEIDTPTDVRISIEMGQEEPLWIDALLVPDGALVNFVLRKGRDSKTHQLSLFGAVRRSKSTENRFTIKGNLGSLGGDRLDPSVTVIVFPWKDSRDGSVVRPISLILDDGKFLIEGDVQEPQIVDILFFNRGTLDVDITKAIVEPNSEITVSWRKVGRWYSNKKELLVTAKEGRHVELIESWRESKEYLQAINAWQVSRAMSPNPLFTSEETENNDEYAQKALETFVSTADEGCTDIKVEFDRLVSAGAQMSREESSEYAKLSRDSQRLQDIRTNALRNIAENSEDPINVLLAMELGAFSNDDINQEIALDIYDRLANELDEEMVARRVTPLQEDLVRQIARKKAYKELFPGQKVPDATLFNLQHEAVEIYEVLEENDFVLIDFWTFWKSGCVRCKEALPIMKSLYDEYGLRGFEIISISIDNSHQSWVEASEQRAVPWINLGENEGSKGAVAYAYANPQRVFIPPRNYLVDSNGCILTEVFSTDTLEKFLVAHLGADADSQNPN